MNFDPDPLVYKSASTFTTAKNPKEKSIQRIISEIDSEQADKETDL